MTNIEPLRALATPPTPPVKKDKRNKFQKGHAKAGGRKVGSTNRTTAVLKEAILLAAELEGWDGKGLDGLTGFLRNVAREDLRTFCTLLGRVLPYTIEAKRETVVEVTYRSSDEVRRELQSRGIDIEVITRIMNAPPQAIEHDDEPEDEPEDDDR